jgi:hypothetical protein
LLHDLVLFCTSEGEWQALSLLQSQPFNQLIPPAHLTKSPRRVPGRGFLMPQIHFASLAIPSLLLAGHFKIYLDAM